MPPERTPDAFLSYTRFDDRKRRISAFRKHLEDAVRELTGEEFQIFQDVDGIGLGERWRDKLDDILNEARFFIPIITPEYLNSDACREELDTFLRAEARRGRNDLVLPIYYIESEKLEEEGLRAADRLAAIIHERQRQDWRNLRHERFGAPKVQRELVRLAREIIRARKRAMPSPGAPSRSSGFRLAAQSARTVGAPSWPVEPNDLDIIRDGDFAPELVVLPRGQFVMGSTEAERQWAIKRDAKQKRVASEKPQHRVKIEHRLATGLYPVTFEEWDRYADDGTWHRSECLKPYRPHDQGWGRGKHPLINVSWDDIQGYLRWLSGKTGHPYRLLSEAEWEYACRAGSKSRYHVGSKITHLDANFGQKVGRTTEVGFYTPNAWGLYDMHGNVWEWVEDCWNENYHGAPDDGSAWRSGDCSSRVVRGGSWGSPKSKLRSAYRNKRKADDRDNVVGFRVARTLAEQAAKTLVKDTRSNRLEYHNPALSGQVSFNYSNNNGIYSIGRDEFFFETKWSKASDCSIHLYSDPPSIAGVAEAPGLKSYEHVGDPAGYDMSSRARTIQEGEHAMLKNRFGKYAVLRIIDIKDRTRSDSVDELTFEFWILTDKS